MEGDFSPKMRETFAQNFEKEERKEKLSEDKKGAESQINSSSSAERLGDTM